MSNFEWRYLKESDYETLVEWWKWFRFPAPHKSLLPNNGLGGVMIIKDGVEVCAGFLFQTNSAFCILEYIVSNPNYRNKDRKQAIEKLIEVIGNIADELGYYVMTSFVNNQNLIKTFEETGFIKGSNNVQYLKGL